MSQINPFFAEEYLDVARTRYTDQFKDQLVFDKYVELWLTSSVEIQSALKSLMQDRSLDTAQGVQLDIIGDIVGQPRSPIPGYVFDQTDPVVPNDEMYRLLIKAKIIKNNTNATPEDVIFGTEFILGVSGVTIQESVAAYIVYVPRILNNFEKYLVTGIVTEFYTYTLLPKPVGVRVDFIEFTGANVFAFVGVPNAKGFGTYTGTYGYGASYGTNYGDSDFNTVEGGIFANFVEV